MREHGVLLLNQAHYLDKKSTASIFFDLFRALAALAVLLHHIRPSFFVNYSEVDHKNALTQLFYLISTKGYQSVMIFFVLSGFFISASVIGSISKRNWSWPAYLNNRITRLGVVLFPALVLTFLWNEVSLFWFHEHALVGHMEWSTFFMNLFFLQGIGPFPSHMYGENDALWSLSIEFWFYILFPCLLLCFTSKTIKNKLIYGVLAVALIVFLGKTVVLLFLIWLLGTVVLLLPDFKAPSRFFSRLLLLSVPLLLFGGAFLLSGRSKDFLVNFVVGLTFALLLYVVRVLFNQRTYRTGSAFNMLVLKTAGFSYTLYLTHFPLNNLLVSYIDGRKFQPTAGSFLIFVGIVAAVVLYAWAISLVTEERTATVRRAFMRIGSQVSAVFKRNKSGRAPTEISG